MKKGIWLFILLMIIVACEKENKSFTSQPPDFFYKKTKQGLSKDSLTHYLGILKEIPTEQLSDSLQAEYAYMTSRFYDRLQNYDASIEQLIFATSFTEEKIKNNREIRFFRALKETYLRRKNDYLNAAGVNEKMHKLLDSSDYKNKAYVFHFNQRIQTALGKPEKALSANRKSKNLFLKAKDTTNYLIATLDGASILTSLSRNEEAEQELNKVVPFKRLLSADMVYHLYSSQGYTYNSKKEYIKALNAYKKALLYAKQLNPRTGLQRVAHSYLNIGVMYSKLNDLPKSKVYIDSVFHKGIQHLRFTDQQEALRTNLEISYKESDNFDAVSSRIDSLFSFLQKSSDKRINSELQVLKESFKKERNLQVEKNEAEVKSLKFQRNQYILIALLLIVIVLTVLILNFYRQRRFKIEKQNFLLQQRLLRSQMNPHFVFNSLSMIKQSVENNQNQYAKYIVKFSRLLRTIFDNSTQDYVALEDELQSIEDYIELQQFRFPNRFDYTIENKISSENELLIPPMLLQPFVENAVIHAFGKLKEKGNLYIELSKQPDFITCIVEDNGVGMNKNDLKKNSSMYLIDQFLFKMTGKKLIITNQEGAIGTKIEIKIPYKEL
ncbi:histidine kinase [Tenacibaculum sp. MEBiC06402]|uniref:histidine kinase n=1 Tax=unclassified Tenacibaculum TaxID=2635139 RepID=UPI003B9B0AE1